jgi:hypothetical protein
MLRFGELCLAILTLDHASLICPGFFLERWGKGVYKLHFGGPWKLEILTVTVLLGHSVRRDASLWPQPVFRHGEVVFSISKFPSVSVTL